MLSNKLTFSLSFIVMLVFGLALLATTADAAKYKATWDTSGEGEWDISIFIPVDDDNPLAENGTDPAEDAITIDSNQDDDIDGVDLKDAKGMAIATSTSSITATAVQSDLTTAATDRADVFAHQYDFSVTPPADPAGLADLQDDTAITMTLGDYTPVVIGLMHRTSGIETTAFVETELGVNTFTVTITTATSPFAVLVASEEPMVDDDSVLMNGIRTGTNFIPDGVVQEAEGNLPNLDSFFRNGGTIKLLDSGGNGDDPVVTGEAFITEIMWGVDGTNLTRAPTMDSQWIEVYYQGDADEVTLHVQFIFGAHDSTALDAVGNLYLAKWNPPGQSGHSEYGQFNGEPPVSLISMYRKRNLVAGGGLAYDPNAKFAETDAQFGYLLGAWAESQATINMSGAFVGSPGSTHVPARVGEKIGEAVPVQVTAITATPLRFSEARNGPDRDGNVNWLEIENVSDDPVPLKDYEISVVSGVSRNDLHGAEHKDYKKLLARTKEVAALTTHQTGNEHDKAIIGNDDYNADGQNDVKQFPDWMLPAKAFLLIVNRDPEDTILAGGKDIEILANANIDDKTTNKGAGFYYFVTPDVDRAFETRVVSYVGITPATTHSGAPLLVLRSKTDKNETDETIVDVAGSGRFDDQLDRYKYNFNTEIWPLRGTHKIDRGGPNLSADGGVWDLTEGDPHEWWKSKAVNSHGVGYDRGVDLNSSPGTPGYANDSVKDKTTDYKGTSDTTDDVVLLNGNISFSEIMFDASVHAGNERWNLVQWIELYNSSMMEAINLNGWELEIRNSDDHVDSFVDSSFIFGDAIIQPNQTLLLVSARAANDGYQ